MLKFASKALYASTGLFCLAGTCACISYKMNVGAVTGSIQASAAGRETIVIPEPLRELAARRPFLIGAAVRSSALSNAADPAYASNVAQEYNLITPESEMKWDTIHPARNTYNFGPADAVVEFAQTHGMKVRGGNLAWYSSNPSWLTQGNFTSNQLQEILIDHIQTVVGHFKAKYPGVVISWDAVDEPETDDTAWRPSIWSKIGDARDDYIKLALETAHMADANALLFINDDRNEDMGTHSNQIFDLIQTLVNDGAPIDGVGIETHVLLPGPDRSQLTQNIRRYADIGLQAHITEMDVALPLQNGSPGASDLQAQAKIYGDVASACLQSTGCTAFVSWGFSDKYSWIPSSKPGYGAALPFDLNYDPKPAYNAINSAFLQNQ